MLAALLSGACDRRPADREVRRGATGPNVLLITLDTTRADRLGCYGHTAARTPTLDALAGAGIRFEQAFCQVPLTLPSHVSLLTSTFPPTNDISMNGAGVLSDTLPTLAETFEAHGYRTGAFVAAWVLHSAFGLSRGFDHYDDVAGEASESSLGHERPADQVCAAALAWLDRHPETPFFAWVHFFDPHDPYAPPADFREQPADPYDGEIAFADSQVRRLVGWLEANHCRRKTLIVVAGDHGEAFGEHGEHRHGLFVYDTTMRVPLIFSFPERLPQAKVVSADVRLIDVAPTILDLLGWAPPPEMQGESLRPALETEDVVLLPVYGESHYPRAAFGWASLRTYATAEWKYVDAPRGELYDRRADPAELTNVIDQHPEVAAGLREELAELLAGMTRHAAAGVTLDDKGMDALESLGYVAAAAPVESDDDQPRRDPKDMLAVHDGYTRARHLLQQHRFAEVVQVLRPLIAQSPESDDLHRVLGQAYLKLGRLPEAEQALRMSLRVVPNNPSKLCALGDVLHGQQRVDDALECYQQAVAALADYGPAHNRLGVIYAQRGRFAEAAYHFQRHVEIAPTSPEALSNLAGRLCDTGRRAEAVKLARQALQYDPAYAPAHRVLWRALVLARQNTEAISALRTACRVLPDDWVLRRQLAALLATTPQAGPAGIREAVRLAQQCCAAQPDAPQNFEVLAGVYAANGNFAGAVETARRALALAESQGYDELASELRIRLQVYQSSRTR